MTTLKLTDSEAKDVERLLFEASAARRHKLRSMVPCETETMAHWQATQRIERILRSLRIEMARIG